MSEEEKKHDTASDQDEMLLRLEMIKILRPKTTQLENIKAQVLNEIETFNTEETFRQESMRELETLENERLLHIEAVKTIDQDINKLRILMKHSHDESAKVKERTHELLATYTPLKIEIDQTRISIGLDTLPELADVEKILQS